MAFVEQVKGHGLVVVDGVVGVDLLGPGPYQVVRNRDGSLGNRGNFEPVDGRAEHADRPIFCARVEPGRCCGGSAFA